MEQLNYSFFLPVLGDRLSKTDGRRSVHTLAGEAGCSRSVDGRANSCLVASRHPGNCLSLPNACRALVTLCRSDAFSWGPTMSHAHAHEILHSLVDVAACNRPVQMCDHTGTTFLKVIICINIMFSLPYRFTTAF